MLNTMSNTSGVTTFKSQPIITSTAPANTDSSTNIATTAWSNAFWTYVKTQANTWSGTNTFSVQPIITSTAPANTDSSTNIATTAWINTFWTYVKTQANTWSGTNTFSGTTNINTTGSATTTIGSSTKSLYLNGTIYMNDGGGSLTMGSSGTSYINLGAMNTTFNIGGSTSPFNLSSPIRPQYLPTDLTSFNQIGYTSKQYISISQMYYGGDRTFLWWTGIPNGVYICSQILGPDTATNYLRGYIFTSPSAPVYAGNAIGAGMVRIDETDVFYNLGISGSPNRITSSSTISITNSNTFIVLASNFFTAGTPTANINMGLSITRIA